MSWNRFIILIVSIIGLAGITKLVVACAGGDDPYESATFFLNTVNKHPSFVPFYYSPSITFYTDGYEFDKTEINDKLQDPNPPMWKKYTGNQVSAIDIDSFIYRFSKADMENIYRHIKKGDPLNLAAKVSSNGFTKWLINNNQANVAQYLVFAKSCEPYTEPLEAVWNNKTSEYVTPKRDSAAMHLLIVEAIHQYEVLKDNELKQRYAYQAVRMAFYSGRYLETITLFDNMITPNDNFLYYRSLALKAGGLYKTGKKTEAAYLYSLVFDKTKEDKKHIYTSFRWAVNGNIAPVLALCKNDHEKAVLYMMKGLYEYDANDKHTVETIQKAYELDAKTKGIDILMTRNINRAEGSRIPGMAIGGNKNDSELNELNTFAQRVAKEGRCGDAAFWYLSSAYIYILQGDAVNCKNFLLKAHTEKMTPAEEDVHDIVNVLCVMRQEEKVTPEMEAQLLPLLQAVETKGAKSHRYNTLFGNMMVMVLKEVYMAQGNTDKAIYCYSKAAGPSFNAPWNYATDYTDDPGRMLEGMTPDELHAIEAFITKKNKSPFDAWLTETTMYTAGALYELEATKYIRMFQFDKAVEILKKVPEDILKKTELPDIMVSHILDGQVLNASDKAVKYNKLLFAKKMLELQQALKKNPADGRAAYQYANGLYNMSYYGKASHAYDYCRSGTSEYAYFNYKDRSKLADYELEHYNVQTPEKYYVQAYENSTDKEIKARCLFMAAKCWQKNCAPGKEQAYYSADVEAYYRNTFKNPYLQKLKEDYKDTKFCVSAIGTCSYFRDYVKKVK